MISAILSDIHSNLEALEAVIRHAEAAGAERYICLGDVVGYGADPAPTLERLLTLPGLILLRGNHDEAMSETAFNASKRVESAVAWTRGRLSEGQRERLATLPYLHRESGVSYAHACVAHPDQWPYLTGEEPVSQCMAAAGTPLTFIGHVHRPALFYKTLNGALRQLTPEPGVAIPLSPSSRYLINVGSVGQPRDGNSAACYLIHDERAATVTFHRVAYDHRRAGKKIRAAGLDPFFAERLATGR